LALASVLLQVLQSAVSLATRQIRAVVRGAEPQVAVACRPQIGNEQGGAIMRRLSILGQE
jgi:hypothetical protein